MNAFSYLIFSTVWDTRHCTKVNCEDNLIKEKQRFYRVAVLLKWGCCWNCVSEASANAIFSSAKLHWTITLLLLMHTTTTRCCCCNGCFHNTILQNFHKKSWHPHLVKFTQLDSSFFIWPVKIQGTLFFQIL